MAQARWNSIFRSKAAELPEEDTWNLEFDDTIVPNNPAAGWKEYIKKANARFACTTCRRQWPSNKVMVIFHMKLEDGTGTVKVRRCRQSCNRCSEAAMVIPNIEDPTLNALMDTLIGKIRIKCYNENQGGHQRYFQEYEVHNPHEPSNCEGCRLGICNQNQNG
ncbi:receptor-transporting protein 3-like isoform 1-T1 [Synchiropus picturatus]